MWLIMPSDVFGLECTGVSKVYGKIRLLQHSLLSCSAFTWWPLFQKTGHLIAIWSRQIKEYISFCKEKKIDRQTQTYVVLSQELYN